MMVLLSESLLFSYVEALPAAVLAIGIGVVELEALFQAVSDEVDARTM